MKKSKDFSVKWNRIGYSSNKMFSFEKAGDELIGVYQGDHEASNGNLIHTMQLGEVLVDFWGCGLLDKILVADLQGETLKILYNGKKLIKMDIGGKNKKVNVRQYEVSIAEK